MAYHVCPNCLARSYLKEGETLCPVCERPILVAPPSVQQIAMQAAQEAIQRQQEAIQRQQEAAFVAGLQKWEYTWLQMVRGYKGTAFGSGARQWEWLPNPTLPANIQQGTIDIALAYMGNNGWELVHVTPYSNIGAEGSGFTGEEVFWFKRPKP